jgi:hypothetical protein
MRRSSFRWDPVSAGLTREDGNGHPGQTSPVRIRGLPPALAQSWKFRNGGRAGTRTPDLLRVKCKSGPLPDGTEPR